MRMRTLLLLPLLLIPILLTSASLLVLRGQMQQQLRESVADDLAHSAATYRNLERLRGDALRREALLLSYQPSLRALMTTGDARTIQDEGWSYAKLSGADIFALLSSTGKVIALYQADASAGGAGQAAERLSALLSGREQPTSDPTGGTYLFDGERLLEAARQPIYFGSTEHGSVLGYVVIGALIDDAVARDVSETAGSAIAFAVGTKVVSSTLDAESLRSLSAAMQSAATHQATGLLTLDLQRQHYLVDKISLAGHAGQPISLVVLRSLEHFRQTQERLNRMVLAIGVAAALAGGLLAFFVARSLTSPLEVLAGGVAAVGAGNYAAQLPLSGASEIKALSVSIQTMRAKIVEAQARLIATERLATIGQMASSVSHDLRHYLASVYANAEFLAAADLATEERADLLAEIQMSVQGTTDLIDSLLLFTRTGRRLHLSCESVAYLAGRAIHRVSKHPEATGVSIHMQTEGTGEAWVDANKIGRAIYNLVLNGCQAAKQNASMPWVRLRLQEQQERLRIEVSDSGPGVSSSIRDRLFDPFVSANKENGIGLGLTLAATIAQEHGGAIQLENAKDEDGNSVTVFLLTIDRQSGRHSHESGLQEAQVYPEAGLDKAEMARQPEALSETIQQGAHEPLS